MNRFLMTDKNIDIEAKGLLCYIAIKNHTVELITTEDKICDDLQISKYRLKKYIKQLIENEYLQIKKSSDFKNEEKLFLITVKGYPY